MGRAQSRTWGFQGQAHGPDLATLQGSACQVSSVDLPGDTRAGAADRAETGVGMRPGLWLCSLPPSRQPGTMGSVALPILSSEAVSASAPGAGTLRLISAWVGWVCVWELTPGQFLGGRNRVLGKAGSSSCSWLLADLCPAPAAMSK